MRLSNLRIERRDNLSYLICDVETHYSTMSKSLWISCPKEYEQMLADDVYDAFLVALIYPAMFYDEKEIIIDGNISPRLYFHIKNYLLHIIKAYNPDTFLINILPQGFAAAKQTAKHVGTGFTGGVDAFTTLVDRYEKETDSNRKIDMLFFNNFSSHQRITGYTEKNMRDLQKAYYDLLNGFPQSLNIPFVELYSNVFDFWMFKWEYTIRSLANSFTALALQRGIRYYYVSGEFSYREHIINPQDPNMLNLEEITELYLFQHLSTENIEILGEGAKYSRLEKIKYISDYEPARKYLNVCANPRYENGVWNVHNCGICHKCTRTLITLDVLGKLDDYKDVFDIEHFKQTKKNLLRERVLGKGDKAIFINEIINYADTIGYKEFPTKEEAERYYRKEKLKKLPKRIINFIVKSSKIE